MAGGELSPIIESFFDRHHGMFDRKLNFVSFEMALLVLCSGMLCSPLTAAGSCGAYVQVTRVSGHQQAMSVGGSITALDSDQRIQILDTSNAPVRPCACRGPACSPRPNNSSSVPVRFTVTPPDQEVLLSAYLGMQSNWISGFRPGFTTLHSISATGDIFRPPRDSKPIGVLCSQFRQSFQDSIP